MIRNASIGLSPDMSIAVVGAPVYATATDTSKFKTIDIDRQRRYQHHALPTSNQMEQQQKEEAMIDHQQQRDQQGGLDGQSSQIEPEHPPRPRSISSGLEALLSVTAQRRREEELAILESVSKNGAVSHTG